jgi:hypothetical protein
MTKLICLLIASAFAFSLSSAAISCEFHKTAEQNMSKVETAQLEENAGTDDATETSVKSEAAEIDAAGTDSTPKELAKVEEDSSMDKN